MSKNVGRAELVPLEVLFNYDDGDPVTDEVVTATLYDVDGLGEYLDWDTYTFLPSGHTTLNLSLPYTGSDGLYQASPRLFSIGWITNLNLETNQLLVRYTGANSGRFVEENFVLPAPSVAHAGGASGNTWDFVNQACEWRFAEDFLYDDGVNPVFGLKVIFDEDSEILGQMNGVQIRVQMPVGDVQTRNFTSGILPAEGHTLTRTSTGQGYEVANPPIFSGRGDAKLPMAEV